MSTGTDGVDGGSRSFVKPYPWSKILYVKIVGTMGIEDNVRIAHCCANAVKSSGPWIGIADLSETEGFNSKGTDVWKEVFKPITKNIDCVYIASPRAFVLIVTKAWGFAVGKKIYACNNMRELIEEAQKNKLRLPDDILEQRDLMLVPTITLR